MTSSIEPTTATHPANRGSARGLMWRQVQAIGEEPSARGRSWFEPQSRNIQKMAMAHFKACMMADEVVLTLALGRGRVRRRMLVMQPNRRRTSRLEESYIRWSAWLSSSSRRWLHGGPRSSPQRIAGRAVYFCIAMLGAPSASAMSVPGCPGQQMLQLVLAVVPGRLGDAPGGDPPGSQSDGGRVADGSGGITTARKTPAPLCQAPQIRVNLCKQPQGLELPLPYMLGLVFDRVSRHEHNYTSRGDIDTLQIQNFRRAFAAETVDLVARQGEMPGLQQPCRGFSRAG